MIFVVCLDGGGEGRSPDILFLVLLFSCRQCQGYAPWGGTLVWWYDDGRATPLGVVLNKVLLLDGNGF